MNKKIYHYCSYENFLSIIESGIIRLGDVTKSNDTMELQHYFNTFSRIMNIPDKFKIEDESVIKRWREDGEKIKECGSKWQCYGICFGKEDRLVSWERYGDGCRGVSIGFDIDILLEQPYIQDINNALQFGKDKKKVIKEEKDGVFIRENYRNNIDRNKLTFGEISYRDDRGFTLNIVDEILNSEELEEYFVYKSAFTKNKKFEEETEYRITYIRRSEMISNKVVELIKDTSLHEVYGGPRYFEWKFPKNAISQIYLGPGCMIKQENIEEILSNNGYKCSKIIKSQISYRPK